MVKSHLVAPRTSTFEAVDPDDILQVWSYNEDEIVHLVSSDFTYCLRNEYAQERVNYLEF
jgi:hypothetical protein